MNARIWWTIIALLLAVIAVLLLALILIPAPAQAPVIATSTPIGTRPLRELVVVTVPVSGATVGKTFTVAGEAPGNWYFEASFPIEVRDAGNNKVGQGIAQAQSDWMTTAQVPFKADITVADYSGPATLILMRDNPSGLPQNDDSVSIPITVK
ncbi:MAG: Gmad2 immunoglobulin-like domain-containing protein [Patescibacteria group bacterium]|mgnify:FL=1